MKIIKIDVFYASETVKWMDEFMHAADVFEPGKRLALYMRMRCVSKKEAVNLRELCLSVSKAIKESGGCVYFIGVYDVDGVRVHPHSFIMPGIQTLSFLDDNGESTGFSLFNDVLEQIGYTVTTTKQMEVVDVNYE